MSLPPHKQILLDAVEKICRLCNLSETIRHMASAEETALLNFYNVQLEGIKKRLKLSIDQILYESDFTISDYGPLYDTLSYFHNLHPQFRVFATLPEIPKEIFLTLENLFPKKHYERLEPTIVYSPIYNYFELSSLEYFQHLGILLEKGIPDRIILMLPYVDFGNPLVWSILTHELSHAFEANLEIVENFAENFKPHSEDVIRRSKNWAREFCCDIIAIKLMGPSYLNAFLNFSFSIHPWYHTHSESHPHPYSRINYMSNYLKNSSLHSDSSIFYTDLYDQLYSLFSIEEERIQLAMKLEDLIDGLEQKISEINLLDIMKKESLSVIAILTEKLNSGIPLISSYRLTNIDEITKEKEEFLNSQYQPTIKEVEKYYNLLNLANEEPAEPTHILNASWDFRAKRFWDSFKEIFKDSSLSYEEKFINFAEYIDNFSYSIIKSLEISKIHSTFKPKEPK